MALKKLGGVTLWKGAALDLGTSGVSYCLALFLVGISPLKIASACRFNNYNVIGNRVKDKNVYCDLWELKICSLSLAVQIILSALQNLLPGIGCSRTSMSWQKHSILYSRSKFIDSSSFTKGAHPWGLITLP